ncbi:hypothetical protein ACFQDN_21905 [Pseudomonas asuensis]
MNGFSDLDFDALNSFFFNNVIIGLLACIFTLVVPRLQRSWALSKAASICIGTLGFSVVYAIIYFFGLIERWAGPAMEFLGVIAGLTFFAVWSLSVLGLFLGFASIATAPFHKNRRK